MEKIKIFDFDGVFFKNPIDIHREALEKYRDKFPIYFREEIMKHGYISEHLLKLEIGRSYEKIFKKNILIKEWQSKIKKE